MTETAHCASPPCQSVDYCQKHGCRKERDKLDAPPRVTLTDGSQVYDGHRENRGDGQQRDYVVLADEERAKGFVRPVRQSYVHQTCGVKTTMGLALAETYARDPYFYSGTFCCGCRAHFPIGEDGQFVWAGTQEKVGT